MVYLNNASVWPCKLAAEGLTTYERGRNGLMLSKPFPALSVNPLGVAGAGDSVMATGLASLQPMMPTAALACCMAALAVETMGNTPISADSLRNSLEEVLSINRRQSAA